MEAGWGVSDGEAFPNGDSSLAWVFLFMQGVILAHIVASYIVQQNTTQTVKPSQCETYNKPHTAVMSRTHQMWLSFVSST